MEMGGRKAKNKSKEEKSDVRLMDYIFTNISSYPFRFLGKHNPTKEFYEAAAGMYYIEECIKNLPIKKFLGMKNNSVESIKEFFGNKSVLCIIPGDGIVPRVGLIVAEKTEWRVVSIDPCMGMKAGVEDGILEINPYIEKKYKTILPGNLDAIRSTAEDYDYTGYEYDFVILMHIHSHADLPRMSKLFRRNKRLVLTMPCCGHINAKLDRDIVDEGLVPELEGITNKNEYFVYALEPGE